MVKRNLIANYLGQGWTALMGLAFVPLYIKYLGIEAYGLIGLFALLQSWLNLLDMGMTPTLGREMAKFTGGSHTNESIRDLLRSIEIIAIGIALIIAGGVALGSNWIATSWLKTNTLSTEVVAQAFTIMGIVASLRFVEGVYRSAIVGLQRQVLFNVINSIMSTLRGLGAVGILVWVSPTVKVFFLWQGVISFFTLVILGITTYKSVPRGNRGGRFSLEALHLVWRFAGGMVLGTLTGLILRSTDKILITKYLALTDIGYYTFAQTVVGALNVLLGPVNQAIFPRFSELMANNLRIKFIDTFLSASQLVTVVLGSLTIFLILFSHKIIYLWTGDMHLSIHVAPLVRLLAIAKLIESQTWMPYQAQIANGQPSIGVKINIINIMFTVPALFFCLPIYGMLGAAYVLIVSAVISLFMHIYYTFIKGFLPCYREWAVKAVIQPISAAILISLLLTFIEFEHTDKILDLIFLCFVGCLTFTVSLCVADRIRGQLVSFTKTALIVLKNKDL